MRTLDVDNEVYRLVDGTAATDHLSHNQALRRMLGLGVEDVPSRPESAVERHVPRTSPTSSRRVKKRKADLWELVDRGYFKDREVLFLKTAGRVPIPGFEAVVSNGRLVRNGEAFSMTALARDGLNSVGKLSKDVRGPSYWYTEGGESIQEMWERHLTQAGEV